MIEDEKAAQKSGLSAFRYWVRRNSTFPETGPVTLARKRPFSVRKLTVTSRSAQNPMRKGLIATFPKQIMPSRVSRGIRSRSFWSILTTTVSPFLESHAPCVVTKRVFRCFFMWRSSWQYNFESFVSSVPPWEDKPGQANSCHIYGGYIQVAA